MIHKAYLNIRNLLVIVLSAFMLSGCETITYYQQMGQGHLALMNKRELITTRINSPAISSEEKRKLELVLSAKEL